jgi:hypothetical protein
VANCHGVAVSQATLPGLPASVGCTRDPLERHYTPPDLAEACCGWLAEITALGEGPRVVEPSCGGGAFARAIRKTWPLAHLTGIDIDDQAAGLRHCDAALIGDWLDLGVGARADAVIGNPPFSTAIPHVERGLAEVEKAAGVVAMILPWAYGGVGKWQALLEQHPPAWLRPIAGRPWPASMRETALWVWDLSDDSGETRTVFPALEWRH